MPTAINSDADNLNTGYGPDEAANELLKLWDADAQDELSNEPEEEEDEGLLQDEEDSDDETAEELDESDEEEESEEGEDQEEDEESEEDENDKKKRKVLDDKTVVKIKIGDTEEEVPVSQLKRLYGQEKALTQKSMEVAERRKELEGLGERHVAAAETLLTRAKERFAPYAQIDWALAAKELEGDEYQVLKAEAQKAYADVRFFGEELDGYLGEVKKERDSERLVTARNTIKALSDPKTGIPGFDQKMYHAMREYMVSNGLPDDAANSIVEEVPLRFIHKAMLYDKGAKAKTNKVDKKNKKIVKSKASAETTRSTFSKTKQKDAMGRLRNTGSPDDAAEVLMARWDSDD